MNQMSSMASAPFRAPAHVGRRRFTATVGACLAAWPLLATSKTEPSRHRESRPLMGTRVDIAAQSADGALLRMAVDAAFVRMAALTAMMSHYQPTSRVAAIGLASGLQPVHVPHELMQVLEMAQRVSRASAGAFDVTIGSLGQWHFNEATPSMPSAAYIARHLPAVDYRNLVLDRRAQTAYLTQRGMRLDLGGIAKLFILEAGMQVLREHGVQTALVNGGGDVLAMTASHERPWRVGIRDPHHPDRLLAAIDVRQGFVASSGDYERFFVRDGRRYHHLLDPRTGRPTQGPHGVTLVGETLEAVNGLGAAAMVLGTSAGQALLERDRGVAALIAGQQGLWISPSLRERLLAPPRAGGA
jgi:FAD:protein FMN transferase